MDDDERDDVKRAQKCALENRRMDKHSSNYIMIFSSGCLQNIVNHSNDHHHVRCVSLVAQLGLG